MAVLLLTATGGRFECINGVYKLTDAKFHGKPVYQKLIYNENSKSAKIYYWFDETDVFTGWYIGPDAGSDEVWAYCPHGFVQRPLQQKQQQPKG